MKLLLVISVLLSMIAFIHAQCPSRPRPSFCRERRNVGRRGRRCRARTVWYYNTRARGCRRMRYLGCGGNNNRFCSLAACRNTCAGR